MDRGTFQAETNKEVGAANTRRSDGTELCGFMKLSLAPADRLTKSLNGYYVQPNHTAQLSRRNSGYYLD